MSARAAVQIDVAGLTKRFTGIFAVEDVNFGVKEGEIFGLVGPDGAGKTTVMRMLAGVMQPDGGRIVIDDVDVVADPDRAKQHLSYMPQRFGLYEDLTVDENIRFYATSSRFPAACARIAWRRCWPRRTWAHSAGVWRGSSREE